MLSLYIGWRYTAARRKSRSVSFLAGVSIVGLAVGVSLLILVLSVMNGFDRELKQRILGLVPQAAVFHRNKIHDWPQLKSELEQYADVEAAAPFVRLNGLVRYRNNTTAVLLYGFEPSSEQRVSLISDYVPEGVQKRIEAGEDVIILGKGVAEQLDVVEGQRVMMVVPNANNASRSPKIAYFEVVFVLESKTELDASLALSSLAKAAELSGHPNKVTGIRLKIQDLFSAPSLMYEIVMNLGPGYYSSNWTRTHGNLYHAIQMSKNLVGLLMSLIVAIAAFNVVSTLVLVVIDKQGDIAILRTLGASSRQIMTIFIAHGTMIGVLGASAGLAIGCLMALGIEEFVQFIEGLLGLQFLKSDVYPLTYLPTEILVSDIVVVLGTALVMSLLATLYPAWKASRVRPADALRYE